LRDLLLGPRERTPREKAVVNTITLDDAVSAPVMQQIAADSGGQYVHATSA
jgi:Arc/MetJ family transcription regulator